MELILIKYIRLTSTYLCILVHKVFAVDDPVKWHRDNILRNPGHYTPLLPVSPSLVAYIQDRFGAGLWYNALVNLDVTAFQNGKMKYGVISKRRPLVLLSFVQRKQQQKHSKEFSLLRKISIPQVDCTSRCV